MINLTNEQTMKEITNRVTNACMGLKYNKISKKILKITLNQCFIDGLLTIPSIPGNPFLLPANGREININTTFKF
jgi:hypothetical protein